MQQQINRKGKVKHRWLFASLETKENDRGEIAKTVANVDSFRIKKCELSVSGKGEYLMSSVEQQTA